MATELPEELHLGMVVDEWPVHVLLGSTAVMHWVSTDPGRRRAWRVRVEVLAKCEYVPPGPGSIVEHALGKAVRRE
jgi:hypothetical protein